MKQRPVYDNKLIGRNLRRCRKARNISVEQLREYLKIGSVQAIYKWEAGRGYPQTDTMFALMELYEIGLSELLREEVPCFELRFTDRGRCGKMQTALSIKQSGMKRLKRCCSYQKLFRKSGS